MIRVRFAPSPTGYLHIGSLRTFLFNYLFARHGKGTMILRIEDTDQKRFVPGATESLIKTLTQMGLDWDEGPFLRLRSVKSQPKARLPKPPLGHKSLNKIISCFLFRINSKEAIDGQAGPPQAEKIKNEEFIIEQKGKFGPYLQSQRSDIYKNFAQKLIDDDKAYYCFCSETELEQMRQEQIAKKLPPMYDERCRRLSKDEVAKKIQNNQPYVVRLKIPEQGIVKINDLIRGEIQFDYRDVDDPVLLKSDGLPTYHLASVIVDHLMKITHVFRAEEWVSSLPKHIFLYQALNWMPPQFAHLPLVLNPDRSKLSKRQGDVAVEDYLAKGYLPEALINFMALLGWSAQGPLGRSGSAHERNEMSGNPRKEEIFSLKRLIKEFSIEKLQKAGAIFNIDKLDWLNGLYVRQLDNKILTTLCLPYLINNGLVQQNGNQLIIKETGETISMNWLGKIIKLDQERLKKLSEISDKTKFFFTNKLDYEAGILVWKKSDPIKTKENLQIIYDELKNLLSQKFTAQIIQAILNRLGQDRGVGDIFWPFRVALTGMQSSPPPAEIAEIMGLEKTLGRIKVALDKLSQMI